MKSAQEALVEQYVHEALANFGRRLTSTNRPGSVVRTTVTRGQRPTRRVLPTYVEDEVRRRIVCPICGRSHAVYGASAFCPFCGALPSLDVALDSLARARKALALEDLVPEDVRHEVDAEGVFDSFANDALKSGVTVFETFTRAHFTRAVANADDVIRKEGRGMFQRLDDLDAKYAGHVGYALSSPSAL